MGVNICGNDNVTYYDVQSIYRENNFGKKIWKYVHFKFQFHLLLENMTKLMLKIDNKVE